jgi:hypothetical protein
MFDSRRGSPGNFYHCLPFHLPLADKQMVEANPHELIFPQGSRQPSQQCSAGVLSHRDTVSFIQYTQFVIKLGNFVEINDAGFHGADLKVPALLSNADYSVHKSRQFPLAFDTVLNEVVQLHGE